jgi:hypothetical protein
MTQAIFTTSIVQPTEAESVNDSQDLFLETAEPTQEKFKISIQICAIKKKCRKIERHFFSLSYVDYNNGNYDQNAIRQLVIDFVAGNIKTVCSHCVVSLDHVVQSFNGRFNCETWLPFSDKNIRFEIAQSAFHN